MSAILERLEAVPPLDTRPAYTDADYTGPTLNDYEPPTPLDEAFYEGLCNGLGMEQPEPPTGYGEPQRLAYFAGHAAGVRECWAEVGRWRSTWDQYVDEDFASGSPDAHLIRGSMGHGSGPDWEA